MFDLREWLKSNMVEGVTTGQVSLPFTAMKATDYLAKGILTNEDVEYIATNAVEPTVQETTEEVTEDTGTETTDAGSTESAITE
ncbi:hypothetical protein [Anaerovorax odorimutans]|uniref:hypothetical protein n=1 Tax=Anaerovorax odorimutans TaxID=109327 RepID=UPI00040D8FD0|nr:hypothetical protein [Anaerovorax odorimutans]